jgi:hypothetical protein
MARTPLLQGLLLLLVFPASLHGGQRDVVSGFVVEGSSGGDDFLMSRSSGAAPFLGLSGGPAGEDPAVPGRARLEIERDGSGAGGLPHGRILRRLPDEFVWPAGVELSPERFAGGSNAMNPGFNEFDPFAVTAPADSGGGGGPTDSDGDGVPDDDDAFPNDPDESSDHDGDGTGDNADTDDDNDTLPDLYETENGLDPRVNDASQDPDGDGFTNREEYDAGTAARDGASFLRFEGISRPAPDTLRLTWQAVPGRRYAIRRLPGLTAPPEPVRENITVLSPQVVSEELPVTSLSDFFFLHVELQP